MLLVCAAVTAVLCAVSGQAYDGLAHASSGSNGFIVLTGLGYLGAVALLAAAWWQYRAVGRTRVIVLIVLATLAAGYVAANLLGLSIPAVDDETGFLRPPYSLHRAGLVAGAVLYLGALAEITVEVVAERRISRV